MGLGEKLGYLVTWATEKALTERVTGTLKGVYPAILHREERPPQNATLYLLNSDDGDMIVGVTTESSSSADEDIGKRISMIFSKKRFSGRALSNSEMLPDGSFNVIDATAYRQAMRYKVV